MPEGSTIFGLRRRAAQHIDSLDVDVILQYLLGYSKTQLYLQQENEVDSNLERVFWELVQRRKLHEPVAYLVGKREFYGRDFAVSPAVLIPRPETEHLVERALTLLDAWIREETRQITLVDVGIGSGAILLSVLLELEIRHPNCSARIVSYGIDKSPESLKVAERNAQSLGVSPHPKFLTGDLLAPLALCSVNDDSKFLIVSNPPYIGRQENLMPDVEKFEPHMALFGGEEGIELPQRLLAEVSSFFSSRSGAFLMEIGHGQADRLVSEALLQEFEIEKIRDFSGKERVLEFVSRNMTR